MNNKSESLKEKLKQALNSTAKVISDDFYTKDNEEQNKSSKKFDFFNIGVAKVSFEKYYGFFCNFWTSAKKKLL